MQWIAFPCDCGCTAFLVASTIFFGLICFVRSRRPKNFPFGPTGLPIVGYAPFLGENGAETIRKMKGKYGSVMSIQLGMEDWVVLNDFGTINEGLVKQGEKFSGRPQNFVVHLITQGNGLVFVDYGQIWKNLRKFGLMTLRGFGVGKKGMEADVIEELPYLVESMTADDNIAVGPKLTMAVSNIICRVVFGSRFAYDDKKFATMIRLIREVAFGEGSDGKLLLALVAVPSLRFVPPFKGAFHRGMKKIEVLMDILRGIIAEHEATFDENDLRDFIDAFLNEMKKKGKNDPSFSEPQLLQYIRDLFEGGTGTTSSTLSWMVLVFANRPECQEKIAKEIENVVGESIPTMRHREEMPYTRAFIQEILRHRTLAPLSIFHKTNAEATIGGFTIPKNTTILPNIWAVHYDPELFENPEEFRPERFLDENGKFVGSKHVIAFSVGPRHCLGEQLARMELFIFLTGIVQKLRVVSDPQHPVPPINFRKYNFLSTFEPPEIRVKFEKR